MGRPKAFDVDLALESAVGVFADHGFEGTSAQMLVEHLGIGRQSLYDTFGDKRGLYHAAVRHYGAREVTAHLEALRKPHRAIDGIAAVFDRVLAEAEHPCLGMGSICEFGTSDPELLAVHEPAARVLRAALADRVRRDVEAAELPSDLDPGGVAEFVVASIAGMRIAARGGAAAGQLRSLRDMALRALR